MTNVSVFSTPLGCLYHRQLLEAHILHLTATTRSSNFQVEVLDKRELKHECS